MAGSVIEVGCQEKPSHPRNGLPMFSFALPQRTFGAGSLKWICIKPIKRF
jgi:hypothetical protein